ncbi:hypothetical protein DUI87_07409 [Hirundo rustica rustica]|uniref:PX domain-containing protein n=1 Tax=Hirundo rustica rustica TaxID=333673 RepID=A0A3M0KQ03_HIRRU|nr:hypothetical protein DUI87_07409 [Hirundo rustica rustica]
MATPYVPVPIPIGSSSSSFTNRNQRSSSFGSISTSSSSSKGQLEDSTVASFKKMSMPDQIGSTSSACSSPLVRTKFTGLDTSIEYCTQPVEEIEQNEDSRNWEDRPSTPTILGYEVMEERAKFTVYKILVKRSPEESWVVFRRYTDFSRLNDKVGIINRCCLEKETNPQPSTATFQKAVESDKVTSESAFLKAKHPSSLIHSLQGLCSKPLTSLAASSGCTQGLSILPKLRGPELDTALKVWPHQCQYRGRLTSLLLLATPFLIQARMPLALLATWAHCWLMFSCWHQCPKVPFLLSSHTVPSL